MAIVQACWAPGPSRSSATAPKPSSLDARWERLDPLQRRQQTLDGIKRLLLRESQVQPVLLLLEDLHWIDSETQALLDNLVESVPSARLLLLVNYRPEYQHTWGSKTYYRQLRIDPLLPESSEELLDTLLGNDPELRPLKRLLIERTEGNPFFLEESVRTLVETAVLSGERASEVGQTNRLLPTVKECQELPSSACRVGFSGSRAAIVERNAKLLDQLPSYPDAALSEFVTQEKGRLATEIEAERRSETERDRRTDERFE